MATVNPFSNTALLDDEEETESTFVVKKAGTGPKPFRVVNTGTGQTVGLFKTRPEAEAKASSMNSSSDSEETEESEGTEMDSLFGKESSEEPAMSGEKSCPFCDAMESHMNGEHDTLSVRSKI